MEDIRIINEVMPVIEVNFKEVKTALEDTLTKYKNLVVTEETLSGCKATQKELAGVRAKIDTYRKEKKKALSEPITAFENQCKELTALIEKAEQPIKQGIKVFDDKKRDTKRIEAEEIIKDTIASDGLNEKYGAQLDVLEKYCNLTAKKGDVKTDVGQRAFALKVEQDREQELLDIIEDAIRAENERLTKKLAMADFQRLVKVGASTKDILAEIKQRANAIYEAEHPAPQEEPKEEPAPQTLGSIPASPQPDTEPQEEPEQCYMEIRCVGTLGQLKEALGMVRANGVVCTVQNQGKL